MPISACTKKLRSHLRRIAALFVTLTLSALSAPLAQADPGIIHGPVINPANGHTYYLLDQSNWTDAEAAAVNLGGHLVTVNNAAEDQYIFNNFAHFGGVERALWIGLNDIASEGTYVWTSGEPVTYTNWDPVQPDNGGGGGDEDYVHLFQTGVPFGFVPGKWNDLPNISSAGVTVPVLNGVVEVDTSTDAPILIDPVENGTYAGSVPVNFTLPEAAQAGSIHLRFHDFPNSVETELLLDTANETAGNHSLTIDATNPVGSPGVAAVLFGGTLPDGTYSVIISYQDTLGNPRAFAFNFNVTIYSSLTSPGYYSALGFGPGTPADPGYYVPNAGSIAQTPCDPGYYQPNAAATLQIPADPGHYVPGPAAVAQIECDPGYYQMFPGKSSQDLAPLGHYVPLAGSQFATAANPGYYVSVMGATAPTPCDPGFYQPGFGFAFQIPADPGYYVSFAASAFQTPADPGFFVPGSASIAQTPCSPGYFQPFPAQSFPILAPAGSYAPGFGSIFALLANPGYYVPLAGSAVQTACDPGYYQPNQGAALQIPADPGYYVPLAASAFEIPANPGNYVPAPASIAQTPCSPGFYQDQPGQSFQIPAALGFYAPGFGSIAAIPADPGHYVDVFGSAAQFECDPGYYQPNFAGTNQIPADPGHYVPLAGASQQLEAPRGYYAPGVANIVPIAGDPGFYVPLPGSANQTPNPPGTYSHAASYVVRSAPTPRDGVTIVSPIYFSFPGDGATIALGTISSVTMVDIAVQNITPDGPTSDSLTDLGITGVDFGGADAANLSVDQALPGVIVAGPAFPTFHERLVVDPGAAGSHSATVTIKTDQNAEPGGVGLEHVYTITWEAGAPLTDPTSTLLYGKGDAVPAAGTDARIPSGAVFTGFGVPAINDDGKVAFVGKWKPATGGNVGIFVGDQLIVAKGDDAADLPGVKYVSFKDPAINAAGEVAFSARIAGSGIVPENYTALFTNAGGTMHLVAQKGYDAPSIAGATIKTFVGFTLDGPDVYYTAKLVQGTGGVSSTDDTALWGWRAGTNTLLVREGSDIGLAFNKPVKSFVALKPSGGTLGHGRGTFAGTTAVRAIFADGTQAVRNFEASGGSHAVFASGDGAPDLSGVTMTKFGLPAIGGTADAVILAKLTGSGISGANNQAIVSQSGTLAFQKGDAAPGLPGLTLASFKDPVFSGLGDIAVPVKLGGAVTNKTALVWLTGVTPATVARIGDLAADTTGGETWKGFKNLVLPDQLGPVFTASLLQGTGGVTATNDFGLWGTTSGGINRLLFREGNPVGSKTVKSFKVIAAVSGSPDQRRAFNGNKQLVTIVTFTDGTNGIVRIDVP